MKKVIFLDIDGVLNTQRHNDYCYKNGLNNSDEYGYLFDPEAVTNLKKIIDETGAGIVISSSWKFMGQSKMQKLWKDRRLPGKFVGLTPNSMSDELLINVDLDNKDIMSIRGQEIKEWLMQQGSDITHYVILDDMNDILQEQENHFVWIDPEVGITTGNVVQAIMILNHLH